MPVFLYPTNLANLDVEWGESIDWVATGACALFACLGPLLFGFDVGVTPGAVRAVTAEALSREDWTDAIALECNLLPSISMCGALFSSLVLLLMGNRLGRRQELLMAALLYGISSTACHFSRTLEDLLALRALYGMAMGLSMHSSSAFISETCPASHRGSLICLKEAMLVCGIIKGYWVSSIVGGDDGGWRHMYSTAAPIALILGVGMWCMPESPRWLMLHYWQAAVRRHRKASGVSRRAHVMSERQRHATVRRTVDSLALTFPLLLDVLPAPTLAQHVRGARMAAGGQGTSGLQAGPYRLVGLDSDDDEAPRLTFVHDDDYIHCRLPTKEHLQSRWLRQLEGAGPPASLEISSCDLLRPLQQGPEPTTQLWDLPLLARGTYSSASGGSASDWCVPNAASSDVSSVPLRTSGTCLGEILLQDGRNLQQSALMSSHQDRHQHNQEHRVLCPSSPAAWRAGQGGASPGIPRMALYGASSEEPSSPRRWRTLQGPGPAHVRQALVRAWGRRAAHNPMLVERELAKMMVSAREASLYGETEDVVH